MARAGSRDTKVSAVDRALSAEIAKFYDDPLGYVLFCFPWDTDASIQVVELVEPWKSRYPGSKFGPDKWACEFLDQVGEQVRERNFDGRHAVQPIRFSTASGHGIGKSALTAWLIKWIMDTRPGCRGTVTAGTDSQLRTKTWAELGKWHDRSLTQHWCEYNNTRGNMRFQNVSRPKEWFCNAVTCKEENAQAFAGQHAVTSTSFYLFDEASAVPDKVYEVRDGGLTDGEPMTFDFGNPDKNSGAFFENTVGKRKHRHIVRQIDSREVAITNKAYLADMVKDFGEESDYVKVRVRGQFPSASDMQFIPTSYVDEAQARPYVHDPFAPLVIGVDVARKGSNNSVIWPRVGMDARTWEPRLFAGLHADELVGRIIETVREFRALGMPCRGLFVDGTGVGGPVCDFLRKYGYDPIEVQFGGSPLDKGTYKYKVDEIWGRMREALKTRLLLPPWASQHGRRLRDELTQREYGLTDPGGQFRLESKDDMQDRLGGDASPDMADALAVTFAQDVAPLSNRLGGHSHTVRRKTEYNPLDGV